MYGQLKQHELTIKLKQELFIHHSIYDFDSQKKGIQDLEIDLESVGK
jgi:hypothetical protein